METQLGEATEQSIETLGSFLRGEVSAAETYRQAIDKVEDPAVRDRLLEARHSHERRARILRQRIVELGGTPSEAAGPWSAFVKLLEGGASVSVDAAALAVLEEGEDHGLADYRRAVESLDAESRDLIENELLPEQERTHGVIEGLAASLH